MCEKLTKWIPELEPYHPLFSAREANIMLHSLLEAAFPKNG